MNNRKRNRKKVMLSTYVKGRVLKLDPLTGSLVPIKPHRIRFYIGVAFDSDRSAPFYYSAVRGNYVLNYDCTNREKRVRLEQINFACKAAGFPVDSDAGKRKKWLERRMRLVIENSLYGADGLTEQELLAKKG